MTIVRPQDLLAQIEALKQRVKNLETNNRAASMTAKAVIVRDADGTAIGQIGAISTLDPDGNPQSGFVFRRMDGTTAFTIYDPYSTEEGFHQFWGFWDREQRIIVSEDAASGSGLARPYLNFAMINPDQSTWPGPTTTTFVDMFYAVLQKQNPYVEIWAQVSVAASTTAEVQMMQGDTVLGDPVTVEAGFEYVTWTQPVGGTFGETIDIHVMARRPTGTGSVKVMVIGAWGRGTP